MTQVKITNFAHLRSDDYGSDKYELYMTVNSGLKYHLDTSFQKVIYFD